MFSLEFVFWKKPFVALKKAVSNNVSKSTCSSITCNNSRENFFQMIDVSATTCTIQVIPKLVDAINKLLLCPGLYPRAQKCFQLQLRLITCLHNPEAMSHGNFTIKLLLENIVILDIDICCHFTPANFFFNS